MKLQNICVCPFSTKDVTCSREWHVGSLSSVPAGVLGLFLEFDQLTKACLNNHAFFLAFIEKLLLPSSESFIGSKWVFLTTIFPNHILGSCINAFIWFAIHERGIESWPCRHQELFLICPNVDNAVLKLHQMIQTRCCIEYWRHRHRCTHKTYEWHILIYYYSGWSFIYYCLHISNHMGFWGFGVLGF